AGLTVMARGPGRSGRARESGRTAGASARLPREGEDLDAERRLGEVAAARARVGDLAQEVVDDAAEPVRVMRALGQRRDLPRLGRRGLSLERELRALEPEETECPFEFHAVGAARGGPRQE